MKLNEILTESDFDDVTQLVAYGFEMADEKYWKHTDYPYLVHDGGDHWYVLDLNNPTKNVPTYTAHSLEEVLDWMGVNRMDPVESGENISTTPEMYNEI